MPKGGHARSGPAPDPKSRTSERSGFTLAPLPAEGYQKRPPGLNALLPNPSARHREIWTQLWKYPQATRWAEQPWMWPTVADLVTLMVQSESEDAPVAVWTALRQLRDDLGLSAAGLKQLGWEISAPTAVTKPATATGADELGRRRERRLRSGAQ